MLFGMLPFTLPTPLTIGCRRLCDPAQSDHRGSYCDAPVFQQHDPTRKRPPRMPKCAQVPHDVSRENADSPDNDQQR